VTASRLDLHIFEIAGLVVDADLGRRDPGREAADLGDAAVAMQLANKKTRQVLNERISAESQAEFKAVLPGSYEVSLNSANDAFVKSISATGSKVAGRTVEIKGPEPVTLALVVAQGQGQVTGVALRNGKPFAGAMIVLVPKNPEANSQLFRRDQSDLDGTFTFHSVIPGAYTVIAIENGWDLDWSKPAVISRYAAHGQKLVVGGSQTAIQLPGPVEIQPK